MAEKLAGSLAADLRRRIISGDIAPGDKLPSETSLMAAHGISRTVVREAITTLQAEGLVQTRRGSGSFALTPPVVSEGRQGLRAVRSPADRQSLLEFRAGVESEAAALAARRRSEAQLSALQAALDAFLAADANPAQALAQDFAFHRIVAEASGNPFFLDTVDALGPTMIAMPAARLEQGGAGRMAAVASEHAAVLSALEAGDPLAAAAAMRTHLVNSLHRVEQESGR